MLTKNFKETLTAHSDRSQEPPQTLRGILRCVIPVVCWKTNGELISVRKHNYNSIKVTQIYVSIIYFILKQGYMFRLEVSHLQGLTTFSLPDALPILGLKMSNF